MLINVWYIWLIIALLCAIAELFTGAFVMLSLGMAAVITGLSSAIFDTNLKEELVIFSVGALVLFFAITPVLKKLSKNKPRLKTGVDAYINAQKELQESISGQSGIGKIKLGSEIWNAKSVSGEDIEKGCMVTIKEVSGTTLLVERSEKNEKHEKDERNNQK